jgi:hypothetical protein
VRKSTRARWEPPLLNRAERLGTRPYDDADTRYACHARLPPEPAFEEEFKYLWTGGSMLPMDFRNQYHVSEAGQHLADSRQPRRRRHEQP